MSMIDHYHEEQVLLGVGAVGALASATAVMGSVTNPPCPAGTQDGAIGCGPSGGTVRGAAAGILLSGIAGLAVAAFVPKYRTAGLSAAATVAGVTFLAITANALRQ